MRFLNKKYGLIIPLFSRLFQGYFLLFIKFWKKKKKINWHFHVYLFLDRSIFNFAFENDLSINLWQIQVILNFCQYGISLSHCAPVDFNLFLRALDSYFFENLSTSSKVVNFLVMESKFLAKKYKFLAKTTMLFLFLMMELVKNLDFWKKKIF